MIAEGDRLPSVKFKVKGPDGVKEVTTDEVFAGKTVVLVAVPGAFTPTCDKHHLPGFIAKAAEIKAKGVDTIAFTSVNDAHVMRAWQESQPGGEAILFLADGSAVFAKAVGLDIDFTAGGMGVRSRRYAMIVTDGVVKVLQVEENPGEATCSAAPSILDRL